MSSCVAAEVTRRTGSANHETIRHPHPTPASRLFRLLHLLHLHALLRLLLRLQMKLMHKPVKQRRHQHSGHRQKRQPAEQRVATREDFARRGVQFRRRPPSRRESSPPCKRRRSTARTRNRDNRTSRSPAPQKEPRPRASHAGPPGRRIPGAAAAVWSDARTRSLLSARRRRILRHGVSEAVTGGEQRIAQG